MLVCSLYQSKLFISVRMPKAQPFRCCGLSIHLLFVHVRCHRANNCMLSWHLLLWRRTTFYLSWTISRMRYLIGKSVTDLLPQLCAWDNACFRMYYVRAVLRYGCWCTLTVAPAFGSPLPNECMVLFGEKNNTIRKDIRSHIQTIKQRWG